MVIVTGAVGSSCGVSVKCCAVCMNTKRVGEYLIYVGSCVYSLIRLFTNLVSLSPFHPEFHCFVSQRCARSARARMTSEGRRL